MKIAFSTLGCKVNRYESQALSEAFKSRGFEIVSEKESADAFLINTCTVTATSDAKSRKTINHIRKNNPDAVIAVMGCFTQAFPEKAKELYNADIVLGTQDRLKAVELVEKALGEKTKIVSINEHPKTATMEKMQITSFDERTRAFVKIQDGCNRFCSYCIIPYARGRICSKPLEDIQKEIEALVKNGYCEFVLVGIDLSSYGKEWGISLTDAVETASKVLGVRRIRLGSLEPEIISENDLLRLSKIKAFCPQFHLSLQSGCDQTLKRMNRHYTSAEYFKIISLIRSVFKNASITTDVMVGFAGESEEEFLSSLEFVKKVGFLKVHVFPYSVREGTRAAEFKNQVPPQIKKERSRKMIEATEEIRQNILKQKIGTEVEILVEGKVHGGYYMGYSQDYTPVYVKELSHNADALATVEITEIFKDGLMGKLKNERTA